MKENAIVIQCDASSEAFQLLSRLRQKPDCIGFRISHRVVVKKVALKTFITVRRLNFSHLRLAKALTARQAACAFCKSNLTKIHLAGRRVRF